MQIFNSLGSNYDIRFAFSALFTGNKREYGENLTTFLRKKYQGQARLFYKGREAIEFVLKKLNLPKASLAGFNGYTCYAVYKSVVNAGLKPYYIDTDNSGLNFSPEQFSEALRANPQIKVLIIQNTLGYPCQIEKIAGICKDNGIVLIEDLAHSVGAIYETGKEAGSVGDFVILSFSRDKIVDAVSGGALIVRNTKYQFEDSLLTGKIGKKQECVDRLYPLFTLLIRTLYILGFGKILHGLLKKSGLLPKIIEKEGADQLRALPDWQAYLTRSAFEKLESNLDHRRKIAGIYEKNLTSTVINKSIAAQISRSSNLRFPIFVGQREGLIQFLKKSGINVLDIWYDAPIAPVRCTPLTDYINQCPNSEKISSTMLNLPTHQDVSEKKAKFIAKQVNLWLKSQ